MEKTHIIWVWTEDLTFFSSLTWENSTKMQSLIKLLLEYVFGITQQRAQGWEAGKKLI